MSIFHVLLCVHSFWLTHPGSVYSFLLAKINRNLFRKINYYLVYMIYGRLSWWTGGPSHPHLLPARRASDEMGGEHAVILMNHYELRLALEAGWSQTEQIFFATAGVR